MPAQSLPTKLSSILAFSSHTSDRETCAEHGLVIGTTGIRQGVRPFLKQSKKIPVIWAGNYSVGVAPKLLFVKQSSLGGYDPELWRCITITKRRPSGTAERLIEILKGYLRRLNVTHGRAGVIGARPEKEIGVHAIRGGDIVGEHTVYFIGDGERIELTHKATDRKIFAQGAVRAAHWAVGREPGIYNMEDVLGLTD